MRAILPQECEVWYVLPVIRKELALILKQEYGLSQRKIASLLGITEAAVSQYIHDKRAATVKISEPVKVLLQDAAVKLQNGSAFIPICNALLKEPSIRQLKCAVHRQVDPSIPAHCTLCNE